MQQIALPLLETTVAPEVSLGLTPWATTSACPPPMVGWWKCRTVGGLKHHRRWWDGTNFSAACNVGSSDQEAAEARMFKTTTPLWKIQWCGLATRHPDHYSYRLFMKEYSHAPRISRRPLHLP